MTEAAGALIRPCLRKPRHHRQSNRWPSSTIPPRCGCSRSSASPSTGLTQTYSRSRGTMVDATTTRLLDAVTSCGRATGRIATRRLHDGNLETGNNDRRKEISGECLPHRLPGIGDRAAGHAPAACDDIEDLARPGQQPAHRRHAHAHAASLWRGRSPRLRQIRRDPNRREATYALTLAETGEFHRLRRPAPGDQRATISATGSASRIGATAMRPRPRTRWSTWRSASRRSMRSTSPAGSSIRRRSASSTNAASSIPGRAC
jgi:hypothetical protein